ncbi:MAG: alpha/beta hydrolase [Acidimicrobiia bacterium]
MPVARINGADLYHEVHGSGNTVLLTHGSWGDSTAWRAVVPGLAKGYEVVTWDRRGHSRSSAGDGPDTLDQDAADLAGLIDHLGRRGAHVYGTSSGGAVVLKMLVTHPDLVSSVAVHEPALPGLLEDTADEATARTLREMNRDLDAVKTMIESGRDEAATEYFIDNVAVGSGAWDQFPEEVKSAYIANAGTYAGELSDPTAFVVDTDALAESTVPILVTLGTESPRLLVETTMELIRQVPTVRVETLEGVGHVPYRTHPDQWLATLFDFYRTMEANKARFRETP